MVGVWPVHGTACCTLRLLLAITNSTAAERACVCDLCGPVCNSDFATNYASVDRDGAPRFTTEFRFVSQDNLIGTVLHYTTHSTH